LDEKNLKNGIKLEKWGKIMGRKNIPVRGLGEKL